MIFWVFELVRIINTCFTSHTNTHTQCHFITFHLLIQSQSHRLCLPFATPWIIIICNNIFQMPKYTHPVAAYERSLMSMLQCQNVSAKIKTIVDLWKPKFNCIPELPEIVMILTWCILRPVYCIPAHTMRCTSTHFGPSWWELVKIIANTHRNARRVNFICAMKRSTLNVESVKRITANRCHFNVIIFRLHI